MKKSTFKVRKMECVHFNCPCFAVSVLAKCPPDVLARRDVPSDRGAQVTLAVKWVSRAPASPAACNDPSHTHTYPLLFILTPDTRMSTKLYLCYPETEPN